MRRTSALPVLTAAFCLLLITPQLHARWAIDLEGGIIYSGYNDVLVPSDGRIPLSLVNELHTAPSLAWRLTTSAVLARRHEISGLVAPLRVNATGRLFNPIMFRESVFRTLETLNVRYRFDSYRLTYRYWFYQTPELQAGIGVTANLRDAAISLEQHRRRAEEKDLGFVPLVNFGLYWQVFSGLNLKLDGDALVGPQGRAEDVTLALESRVTDRLALRLGYRVLEGGADVPRVYSFALFHFALLGAAATF